MLDCGSHSRHSPALDRLRAALNSLEKATRPRQLRATRSPVRFHTVLSRCAGALLIGDGARCNETKAGPGYDPGKWRVRRRAGRPKTTTRKRRIASPPANASTPQAAAVLATTLLKP